MAFTTLNVTVGVAAGVLVAADAATTDRRSISVYNNGSATIYVGPAATVTVAAGSNLGGFPVPVGASLTLDAAPQAELYAISGTAAQDVRIFTEEGS